MRIAKKACLAAAATFGLGAFNAAPAHAATDPFIGEMMMTAASFCPRGWAEANGQLLAISSNSALFSLMGTIYGGDGRTTFALPDMRGRAAIGQGRGPGLTDHRVGMKGGTETNTLMIMNLPPHSHNARTVQSVGAASDVNTQGDGAGQQRMAVSTSEGVAMQSELRTEVSNTGGGQPINNMQPFIAMRWCVALVGVFPSRN